MDWVIPFIIRTPPMDERIPTGQILGLRGFLPVRYWELADSLGPIPTGQILGTGRRGVAYYIAKYLL